MIRITDTISILESELEERFVRASGPGGQNVNKVATAVELRFHVRNSPNLPAPVAARLERLAGRRATKDGVIVIRAERFRTQELNRADALERLIGLIAQAALRPKRRIKTKPSKASRARRRKAKEHRSRLKRDRRSKPGLD